MSPIDLFNAALDLQHFCDSQGWRSCFIEGLLSRYSPRIANAAQFARQSRILLLQSTGGIGLDISLGALPFESELVDRATDFDFTPDVRLRTCSAEDLLILKLFAMRPLDIQDAESIAVRQSPALDWPYIRRQLAPLSAAKEDPSIMAHYERLRRLAAP
jgi:hypothetical protein